MFNVIALGIGVFIFVFTLILSGDVVCNMVLVEKHPRDGKNVINYNSRKVKKAS